MASAAPAETDTAAPPASKGKGGLVTMLVPVVLSVVLSSGISFFLAKKASAPAAADEHGEAAKGEHGEEAAEVPKAANYIPFEPAFVVNLGDPTESRFLQIQVEAMTRDPAAVEAIKAQAPRLRSELLMLLGQQKPADLTTREGKEKLQADVLADVQKIMTEETGKPSVDAVYFTSFVMQ